MRERDPAKSLAIGCNIRMLSKFVAWAQGKGHPSGLKGHDSFGLCHGLASSQTFLEFPAALQVCHAKRDHAHRLFHQLLPGGPNVPSRDDDRPAQAANPRNLGYGFSPLTTLVAQAYILRHQFRYGLVVVGQVARRPQL